jgi:hypothetical protein
MLVFVWEAVMREKAKPSCLSTGLLVGSANGRWLWKEIFQFDLYVISWELNTPCH